jgi:hypothetical protein
MLIFYVKNKETWLILGVQKVLTMATSPLEWGWSSFLGRVFSFWVTGERQDSESLYIICQC